MVHLTQQEFIDLLTHTNDYLRTPQGSELHPPSNILSRLKLSREWASRISIEPLEEGYHLIIKGVGLTDPKAKLPPQIRKLTLEECALTTLEGLRGSITLRHCYHPGPNGVCSITSAGAQINVVNPPQNGTSINFHNTVKHTKVSHELTGLIPRLSISSLSSATLNININTSLLTIQNSNFDHLSIKPNSQIQHLWIKDTNISSLFYANSTKSQVYIGPKKEAPEESEQSNFIGDVELKCTKECFFKIKNIKIHRLYLSSVTELNLNLDNCHLGLISRGSRAGFLSKFSAQNEIDRKLFNSFQGLKLTNSKIVTIDRFPRQASEWPSLRNMAKSQLLDWHLMFEYLYAHSIHAGDSDSARVYKIMSQNSRRRNTSIRQPLQWLILNLYSAISDYGYSIARPLSAFGILFFAMLFYYYNDLGAGLVFEDSLASAMAGAFLFFPRPTSEICNDVLITFHNVASSILLFLISLAVRSRAKI